MNRTRWILLAATAVVAVIAAVVVFRPDKLVVDQRVDETLDTDVAAALDRATTDGSTTTTTTAPPSASPTPAPSPAPTSPPPPAGPVVEGRGTFVEQGGHSIRGGAAVVLRQPDGNRLLVLDELDSQNGPDLQLYLSPSAGGDVDGGVKIAPLKGNIGTQTYELPAEVDLTRLPNVVIWCERFSSPFGTATLG